ncbi:MAG TPA: 50S ribosomal protein L18 [Candidatus Saccharimonadales bacterium]|nr:50S ribosomal protein L18 [Candidatus Saccharimonadales bacterium]
MDRLAHKSLKQRLRKSRVRGRITGTSERPRLSVYISNYHVIAQIIDDTTSKTLVYASTIGKKTATGTLTEQASWVGDELGKLAKAAKINRVVFDRGGKLYHGRVKALADAARKQGLEF